MQRNLRKRQLGSCESRERKNSRLFGYDYGFYPISCFEYRYEVLHLRDVRRIPLQYKSNQKDTMERKVAKVQEDTKNLDEEQHNIFHTYVMKAMFLCKRKRTNIDQEIVFLSSRVKYTYKVYCNTLLRVQSFLKGTINNVLTL